MNKIGSNPCARDKKHITRHREDHNGEILHLFQHISGRHVIKKCNCERYNNVSTERKNISDQTEPSKITKLTEPITNTEPSGKSTTSKLTKPETILKEKEKTVAYSLVNHWPMDNSEKDIVGGKDMVIKENGKYTTDRFGNENSGNSKSFLFLKGSNRSIILFT